MPRNMSFFLTQEQVRKRKKIVTRRNGWWFLKPGDVVNACVKCQGLKKGEKVEKICQIQILSTREEKISNITQEDVVLEGFPDWTTYQFIDMYCQFNKKKPDDLTNRIEFRYLYHPDHVFLFKNICPYCGADKEYTAEGWTQDSDGTWYADMIQGSCLSEPDIEDSEKWDEWWDEHKLDPYQMIAINQKIEMTLKATVRFIME